MKSGIFARMSDEEGGCRIKSDKKERDLRRGVEQ